MALAIKHIRGWALHFLIIAFVTFLLLEVIGVFFYYWKYGGFFYLETLQIRETDRVVEAEVPEFNTKLVLHPYLGYIRRPSLPMSRVAKPARMRRLLNGSQAEPAWTKLSTNNHGFFSDFDYPYNTANSSAFVIGIFGGSVAHWFALQGREMIIQELRECFSFKNREIVVLNFAQGGFKQPQQLQTLSYFLAVGQRLDAIINIDGFNEIALSHINHDRHVDTSMPSAQHVLPLLKLLGSADRNLEILNEIYSLRQSERTLRWIERRMLSTRSAGLHLMLYALYTKASRDQVSAAKSIEDLSDSFKRTELVSLTPFSGDRQISASVEETLALWRTAAETMQKIADATDISYLEVVQPNQYFSEKELSPKELAIAINKNSPYRKAVETGYPLLSDHIRRLRQKGVNIVSAVDIFDNVDGIVYSDSCCHYNQIGNDILAKYIAESLLPILDTEAYATDSCSRDNQSAQAN